MAARTWLEKADRYLDSAELLLKAKDYDSAVSRAYYAARYAAIHLFLARRIGWQSSWQHETIWHKIAEQSRNLQWLRAVLMSGQDDFNESWAELLEQRSSADYKLSNKVTERVARRCIDFARAVVNAMKENAP